MTTDPKDALPPRLDPTCACICHTQPGVMHFAPCCRETDPRDAEIARLTAELASGSFYKESDIDALMARAEKAEAERDAALAQVAMTVFCADCENTTTRTADDRCGACGSGRIMAGNAPSAALSRRDAQMRAEEWSRIETTLRGLISGQSGSLSIAFNEDHAGNYCEAKDWDGYAPGNTDSRIDWVSEEERAKAVANNTVWTLQCYPNTPVSFYCIGASSLSAILAAAEEEAGNG